jgi:hypothetical protein
MQAKQRPKSVDPIEKLNDISDKLDKLLAMCGGGSLIDPPTALYYGGGGFRIGEEAFMVTGSQRVRVIEALLDRGGVGTTKEIEDRCNENGCAIDGAGKILRELKYKRFRDGMAFLEPYIFLPGGGHKGGYSTTIIDKRQNT